MNLDEIEQHRKEKEKRMRDGYFQDYEIMTKENRDRKRYAEDENDNSELA